MAKLLNDSTAKSITNISYLAKGSGSTDRNKSQFFFYSDSPEKVTDGGLADYGFWLNRASVYGEGQIYIWHHNYTGATINTGILIYNPDANNTVKISITNYGSTLSIPKYTDSDSDAWKSYFQGNGSSIIVGPKEYKMLFPRAVKHDCVYGIIAKASITINNTNTAAGVLMYDLAYKSNSSGAVGFAAPETGQRGHGDGYKQTINFATVSFGEETTPKAYDIAYGESTFSGKECSTITDDSGLTSGLLKGAFGQVFDVKLPIYNDTSSSRTFHVFMGNRISGYDTFSFPFVYMDGEYATYHWIQESKYVDVIEVTVAKKAKTTLNFTTVIPSVSSTPFVIGVKPVN